MVASAIAITLALADGAPWPVRWGTLFVSLTIGWRPASELLFMQGRHSVRAFEWEPDGSWRISTRVASSIRVWLAAGSAIVGPWIFLVWVDERRRRYRAVIDAAETGSPAFRRLIGRLRLAPDASKGATDRLVTSSS
jgi:hypothetical protein